MEDFKEKEFSKKIDFEVWKDIFSYTKNCKVTVVMCLVVMIALAMFDTLTPLFSKYAIDNYVVGGRPEEIIEFTIPLLNINFAMKSIYIFVGLYFSLIVVQSFIVYLFIKFAGIIEATIQRDLRQDAFTKLQELSFSYFDKTKAGWIIARLTNDAQKLGNLIAWSLVDIFWGSAIIVCIIIAMFMLNVKLALWSIALIPFIILAGVFFQMKILEGQRKVSRANSVVTAGYSEGIAGAKTSKTLVREDGNLSDFDVMTDRLRSRTIKVQIVNSFFVPIIIFTGIASTAMVLTVGGNSVVEGSVSLGTLSAFISYMMLISEPINQIAAKFSELQSAQASGERIISLIKEESDIVEKPEVTEKYGDFFNPKTENFNKYSGDIEFKDVTFKYKNGQTVLENFNLKINAGEKIALVGETGGGKSTIINLVSRFYEPVEGELLFDGIDYRERSQSWLHSQLSYVLQSPFLFSGTIRDNILYGKEDATEEEIVEACKKVGAYDFIESFEDGLDTNVGEGGDRLSQGQKQLVSFARAIIGSPSLFILDEATSSIDTLTETKIQKAIDEALKGRTSFIVAHRLSTIKNADRIIYISGGKILEDGNHDELLAKKGDYYNLYMNQFKEQQSFA
ncbi:MAG: ABC transporter ATP-binding protein [Lachnospirales bacterium]